MSKIQTEINHLFSDSGFNSICIITSEDITVGLKKLKPGKNDGAGCESSDHMLNACVELYLPIASLFSCMLTHGIAVSDLCISTVIPMPRATRKPSVEAGIRRNAISYTT